MSHDTFVHNLPLLMQDEIWCSFHFFRQTTLANDKSETNEKYTWPHLRTINQPGKLFQEKSMHATWYADIQDLISQLNFHSLCQLSHIRMRTFYWQYPRLWFELGYCGITRLFAFSN